MGLTMGEEEGPQEEEEEGAGLWVGSKTQVVAERFFLE